MRRGAVALCGGGNLLRILFQVFDEFGYARRLEFRRVDDQRVRHMGHHDNRLELLRIKSEFRVEILVDDQRWRGRRKQRVTIGRRMIDELGADVAGSAGAVFDHHRLSPFARQPVSDKPRNGIGGATCWKRGRGTSRAATVSFLLTPAARSCWASNYHASHAPTAT